MCCLISLSPSFNDFHHDISFCGDFFPSKGRKATDLRTQTFVTDNCVRIQALPLAHGTSGELFPSLVFKFFVCKMGMRMELKSQGGVCRFDEATGLKCLEVCQAYSKCLISKCYEYFWGRSLFQVLGQCVYMVWLFNPVIIWGGVGFDPWSTLGTV